MRQNDMKSVSKRITNEFQLSSTHTAQLHKKIRNAINSKRRWGRKIKQDHNGLEIFNFE